MKFKYVKDRLWFPTKREFEDLLNARGSNGWVMCGMNDVGMWCDIIFVKQIA